MSITQEAANLIDTLAHAASQIGSTAASAKINQLIVSLIPSTSDSAEEIAEALRQDNAALQQELNSLQISARIGAENLELLRGKMAEITGLVASLLTTTLDTEIASDLNTVIQLAAPIDPVEA